MASKKTFISQQHARELLKEQGFKIKTSNKNSTYATKGTASVEILHREPDDAGLRDRSTWIYDDDAAKIFKAGFSESALVKLLARN